MPYSFPTPSKKTKREELLSKLETRIDRTEDDYRSMTAYSKNAAAVGLENDIVIMEALKTLLEET